MAYLLGSLFYDHALGAHFCQSYWMVSSTLAHSNMLSLLSTCFACIILSQVLIAWNEFDRWKVGTALMCFWHNLKFLGFSSVIQSLYYYVIIMNKPQKGVQVFMHSGTHIHAAISIALGLSRRK